eukprot:1203699-Prymnesium_polylepis.1
MTKRAACTRLRGSTDSNRDSRGLAWSQCSLGLRKLSISEASSNKEANQSTPMSHSAPVMTSSRLVSLA